MRFAAALAVITILAGCGGGAKNPLAVACGVDGAEVPADLTVQSTGITVEVRRDPFGLVVRDGAGKELTRTAAGGAGDGYGAFGSTSGRLLWSNITLPGYYSFDAVLDPWRDRYVVLAATPQGNDRIALTLGADGTGGPRCAHVTLTTRPGALRVETTVDGESPRAVAAAFESPADEGFLGFGERFNRTEQRGRTLYSWPEEGGVGKGEAQKVGPNNPFPNGEGMTYYPVPFFVSTRGYAFWLDSTWRNQFELADPDKGHSNQWRVFDIGPSLAWEIFTAVPGDARPFTHQVLDAFTARTGRPMVAPPWAFGPRRRIDDDSMVNGVREIEVMRNQDLALTAVDDATHFLPGASQTGREAILKAWTRDLRALGYRGICYFNSLFKKDDKGPLAAEVKDALAKNYFLRDANGAPEEVWLSSGGLSNVYQVDFTSAAATAWFQTHFQAAIDLGYSGWMYDFGEYVQPAALAADGTTGEALHNRYPVIYDKAGFEAMERSAIKGDWMFFTRSGYTGASQYSPITWSGDPTASFEDAVGLPAMVRGGVNMGLSGVPHWGSDIGGYKCIPDGSKVADGELLARWIQLGAASGDMHDENACALGDGDKATIWTAPEARAAWKEYARLHTRLFPYLYSLAKEAHTNGAPLMRHLYFEHPDAPALAAVDDAYYLGPSILVAPVVKRGARTKSINLPPARYLDWHDPAILSGAVTVSAPLDKLPLLLRENHLVPLLDPTIDTLADETNPDVIGPGDVKDVYDVVGFITAGEGGARFSLDGGGTLKVVWLGGDAKPAIPEAADEAALSTCPRCYRIDPIARGITRVRISVPDGDLTAGTLTLSSKTGRRIRWDLYLGR